jgi:hypothetical protein
VNVCLCVYMFCCPVSIDAFATSSSLIQRSPATCLIRVRNPKRHRKTSIDVLTRINCNVQFIMGGVSLVTNQKLYTIIHCTFL